MFKIEDFVFYRGEHIASDQAVLTWSQSVGYQFMFEIDRTNQTVIGVRPVGFDSRSP